MHRFLFRAALLGLLGLAGCARPAGDRAAIDAATIRRHIAALADDSMMGRKPFSEGEEKTVRYLESQFRALGLAPGAGESYYQDVPLVEIDSQPSDTLTVDGGAAPLRLRYRSDYVALSEHEDSVVTLQHSPLVFAGYGVVAPEYGWNDYAGLDVRGKTVIVLVNDPGFQGGDPKFFKGDTMTYYGRWTYKYEEAARQGAAGVLIVHQTLPASYPWSVVQSSFTGSQLYLQDSGHHRGRCAMEGWITEEAARRLLGEAGIHGDINALARRRDFRSRILPLTMSVSFRNHITYKSSRNVVDLLPGSRQPAEYVLYSAHWDHLGVGLPVDGDSIYNGAVDNASGVAALLATAGAFAAMKDRPQRSLVFLAVTAEEQGLLGSAYYAAHPLYPLAATVADLNMDALGNYGRTRDMVVTGMGQNELEDRVKALMAAEGGTVRGDLNPASGGYFRSDHFSFAKVGVPALDIHNGLESLDQDTAKTRQQRAEYGAKKYHQPADEYSADMNVDGMVQVAQLLFTLGRDLSGESAFPGWKAGSEFRAVRDSQLASPGGR